MAKNKLEDLRDHLFETIEALKDAENPMELGRAKAISEVAQTIINSAKVEVQYIKSVREDTGADVRSDFLAPRNGNGHALEPAPMKGLSTGKKLGIA